MEVASFHLHCLVTIFMTKPRRRPRTVIQASRSFDGCVAQFHLKVTFSILRLAINSFRVRTVAVLNVIFYIFSISLHIVYRVWRSRLKQMRTSVQRWTSRTVFVSCILAFPIHVQGFSGVRAPTHCELMIQHSYKIWLVRTVA